jgi:hypothetical protein
MELDHGIERRRELAGGKVLGPPVHRQDRAVPLDRRSDLER